MPRLLPACVEATDGDASRAAQQFRFDEAGRLLEHRTFFRGRELARDRYTWAPGKLTIEGAAGHVEVTLGAHGEALVVEEGLARSTLIWNGTFAQASGFPNLEGAYTVSAGGGSRHLPQDTTARGIHQRMGTFRFTGTVSVRDALGQTVVSTYEGGRVIGWASKREIGQVRWTLDGAPEQESTGRHEGEESAENGRIGELLYERQGGRTVATHYRRDSLRRDTAFSWSDEGHLVRVDSTQKDGQEVSSKTVLLGPCNEQTQLRP